MKTTLEIPDDLMREIKVRAAKEDRKLKDLVAELLRRGLAEAETEAPKVRHRVKFPFVQGRPARPGEEATPEVVAQILTDQEVEWYTTR
jgi:hypothetical protein